MNPPVVAAQSQGLVGQLLAVFLYLGSEWVMYLLLCLSVISVGIALERAVYFARRRGNAAKLGADLRTLLREGKRGAAIERAHNERSLAGRVAEAGLSALDGGPAAAEEEMSAATIRERSQFERGLAYLGTLGNNAPFVGLFGTVLGIIRSFRDLAQNSAQGASAVMTGIAEALVATAVGLLVALPAVALFNTFQRYLKSMVNDAVEMNHVVLSFAKQEPTSPAQPLRNAKSG